MSKRGADEYITKEHGSTLNAPSDNSKVKMATAAQLAKRKMAVPKSRAGRTGQSQLPGSGTSSSPFQSISGASQNNNQSQIFPNSGGVTFGASTSQSFPPSDSSSSSSNGFNFQIPGQASSFTFGQPVPNNPFANSNGNTNNQQPQSQDTNDITMESPQKKPAFGSGLFGSSDTNNTQSTGFSFGQPTTQPPSQPAFSFGQSTGFGSTSGTSLFGQNNSKPPESSSPNPFGQLAQSQTNTKSDAPVSFGQSSTVPPQQTSSSGFTFGQSTTAAPTSTPAFSFGQTATSAPSASSGFTFGKSTAQSADNGPLFAGTAQSSMPAFGSAAPSSQPTPSIPSFGSAPATTSSNIFSGFGSSKPTENASKSETTTPQDQPSPSPFGQSTGVNQDQSEPTTTAQDPPKLNPFAGLFAPSTPKSTSDADAPKPLFSFAAPSQPSGLFSASKSTSAESTIKAPEDAKKPAFSFGTPSTAPSTGLFSPSKPSTEPSTVANPFAGLSGANTKPFSEQTQAQPLFGIAKDTPKSAEAGFKPLPTFGNLSGNSIASSDQSTPKPFGDFGRTQPAAPTPAQKRSIEDRDSQPQNKMPAFGATPAATPKDTAASTIDLFTATAKAAATSAPNRSSATPSSMVDDPKRSVNTYPPTRIPPYLNGDDYKAYDSNYRLHSLNREFQKRIASLDPSKEDFENIVRNYVAARESIGESIGLYTRNVAGMKRKADGDDSQDDGSPSAKRTKSTNATTSNSLFGGNPSTNIASQPPASSLFNPSTTSTNSSLNSGAASSAPSTSLVPPPSNPFASLAKTGTTSSNEPSAKPAFSFGSSTSASAPPGSTTPIKSPPKKPTFEMPKFAAPAGGMNFMDAFKKNSEENAAKFAKDAKAKRKAEDFDSDEDDEEEWERKYEEEEKAKKAKLEAVAQKGFTPVFGNGTSSPIKPVSNFGASTNANSTILKPRKGLVFGNQSFGKSSDKPIDISDNDTSGNDEEADDEEGSGSAADGDQDEEEEEEAEEDDLPEDEIEADDENEEDDDLETTMAKSRNKGKSLFERISANPDMPKDPSTANAGSTDKDDTKNKPVFGKGTSGITSSSSASKEPYVPSKTFNFTPSPAVTSPTPVPGASIFAGGIMRDGPIAGEGLFGSRPSTPSNSEKPKSNIFGNLGTPSATSGADNTWKKGSEIKFGNTDAPAVSITAPSPRKDESKPFANLFGAASSANNSASSSSVGFGFGQQPVPGFLAAASHLAGGSGTNSGFSSRATSPGTTDNESVATNEEDYSNDTQVSLMETRPGEENENVVFETRARALRFYTAKQIEGTKLINGWNSVGLGIARLLKHKETGKTRLVMRAEPGANIILNTNLQPELKYEYAAQGAAGTVKFQVVTNEGPQGWVLKVKTHQLAQDLANSMEENKKPST